ncbi:hypothetical protein RRG08_003323 [Elysia crispata]|uniref:Uncharacterized protein n=1 Tax=Elysia crispata TaxID=231223 RepID=A0AAE1E466_9GAST|nr:hypothetical protein RRG08_003323 [Elysia crispata]
MYCDFTPGSVFCSCSECWAARALLLEQYVRKAQPETDTQRDIEGQQLGGASRLARKDESSTSFLRLDCGVYENQEPTVGRSSRMSWHLVPTGMQVLRQCEL